MLRGKPTGQVETTSQSKLLCERPEENSRSGALRLARASRRLKSRVKSIQRSIRRTCMKVERGPAALDRIKNIIFHTVFKESKNEGPL
jgi:hypothetical protein